MRTVSNAFLEASLSPISYANAYMVINNSTTIDASNITEISIQEDVGDTGAFSVGTFNATEANITVLTKALPNTITGVPIKIYFGYYIGGNYEYVPMGTFYAQAKDVTRKNYFTVIKAYDTSMRMSDGYRSTLNWNNTHTVTEVLNEIKTAYSFTLGSFGGLPPSSVTVYKIPTGTYRDVVMQMALLMGTNAKFNRSGLLDFIRTYPSAPVESYNASNYGLGDLQLASVSPISYGKMIVHYHYTSGGEEQTTTFEYTAGTGSQAIVVDTVNVGTAQETSALGSTVLGSNGMSYYGYDVTLPGQPQIDLGDTIRVEDLYGNEYDLLVMSATHTFNGAMKSTFSAIANEEDPSLDGENMGASITEQVSTINDAALYAVGKAEFAATKADEASGYADQSRISSEASAASAAESARQAGIATGYANTAQQQATASAQSASASAQSASQAASSASAAATSAQNAADDAADANTYANAALDQLGIVQDVIGVLEWASTHGTFTLTTDTTVQEHKVYFTYNSSTGDYEPVIAPEGNPRQQGYYELSMTEAMQEFILSHLAVTSRGLWVLPNGMGTATDAQYAPNYKVLLSNNGMYVYDGTGVAVSTYGENITFSATRPQSIGNANAGISFNPDNGGTITITGATINIGNQTLDQVLAEKADSDDIPTKTSDLNNDSNFANTTQVNTAKNEAISTASTDATNKANDAKKVATNFLAVDSSGIMVYDGVNGTQTPTAPSASTKNVFIDSDSVDIRQGTTVLATFGETSRIGKQSATHTDISSNGMQIYASNGSTLIAQLGYGEGTSEQGTQVTQPFYTFGTRGGTVGNYSVTSGTKVVANNVEYPIIASGYASHAEGTGTTASGNSSHAEGSRTTASGIQSHAEGDSTTASSSQSHAEGFGTTASGSSSHAEGTNTTASGSSSHAEGRSTTASGGYSHAANYGTIAEYDYQTAIGFYNDNSSKNLFEIGNGDLITGSRSNAFEVDWFGNVTIPSGAKYMVGTSGISDFVVEQGTSGIWTYRKWDSGISECWGTSTRSNVAMGQWGSTALYYGTITADSWPSNLFTSAPNANMFARVSGGNGWLTQTTNMTSSTTGTRYVIGVSNATLSAVNVVTHAYGRWK